MKIEKVMTNIEYTATNSGVMAKYDYVYILDDEIVIESMWCDTKTSISYLSTKKMVDFRLNIPYTGIITRSQENKYYQDEYALGCDGMIEDVLYELREHDGIEAFILYMGELIGHLTLNKETQDFTLTSNFANGWWRTY